MKNKELDTVLKSVKYKKERDELCDILDEINHTIDAMEDGRRIKLLPKGYLDKSNKLMTYEWEDGSTKYTSYYTYNPSHDTPSQTDTQTDSNTPSQNSSSYTGGGGDFSGGGSGGSWD